MGRVVLASIAWLAASALGASPGAAAEGPKGSAAPTASVPASPAPRDSLGCALCSAGFSAQPRSSEARSAPDFDLAQVDGGTLSLAEQRGHPVWLAFWAAGCVSCEPALQAMDTAYREYGSLGLAVIGIAVTTDQATASDYVSSLGLSFPVALDEDGSVFLSYRALNLPAHFWIDGDGLIRETAEGDVPPEVMAVDVLSILPAAVPSGAP